MSTRSVVTALCIVGAAAVIGCGGGSSAPGNAPPRIDPPVVPMVWTDSAVNADFITLGGVSDAETVDPTALLFGVPTQPSVNDGTWGTVDITDPTDVIYTPSGSHDGVEYFTFSVSDGIATVTASVWVGVNNTAPYGPGGTVALTTDEDTPLVIAVGDLGVTDDEDDPVLFVLDTDVTNGSLSAFPTTLVDLTVPATGLVTYTPALNYPHCPVGDTDGMGDDDPGIDTFSFTVTDMVGTSAVIDVEITIDAVNDAPVTTDVQLNVQAGAEILVPLSVYSSDPDNDLLTYAVTSLPGTGILYDGLDSATGTPIGAVPHAVVNANGDLCFAAPYTPWGDYTFTYEVTDGVVAPVTGTISLTIEPPEQTCYGWGWHQWGQLGIGENDGPFNNYEFRTPQKLDGNHWWVADGGGQHSVILDQMGGFRVCGDNNSGQLGLGPPSLVAYKRDLAGVGGLQSVRHASGGLSHSLVVCPRSVPHQDTYGVWSMGLNSTGQLGDGTEVTQRYPVEVLFQDALDGTGNTVYPNIVMVSAGNAHSLALDEDGNVWAWGSDSNGQLGIAEAGAVGRQRYAVEIGGGNIVAIAAGGNHSVALSAGGIVYTWGEYDQGQLGRPPIPTYNIPVAAMGGAQSIAAGLSHTLAAGTGGNIYAWGDNQFGQLGNDDYPNDSDVPVLVVAYESDGTTPVAEDFVEVAAGGYHSIVRTIVAGGPPWTGGRVFACGRNESGQVGINSADDRVETWQEVGGLPSPANGLGAGNQHSFAILQEW